MRRMAFRVGGNGKSMKRIRRKQGKEETKGKRRPTSQLKGNCKL
jgi:hypothetical protein